MGKIAAHRKRRYSFCTSTLPSLVLTDLVPTGGKIGCSFAIEDENRQKNKNFVGIGERLASETECKQSDIKRLEYE